MLFGPTIMRFTIYFLYNLVNKQTRCWHNLFIYLKLAVCLISNLYNEIPGGQVPLVQVCGHPCTIVQIHQTIALQDLHSALTCIHAHSEQYACTARWFPYFFVSRQASGANIKIAGAEEGSSMRMVTISGPPEAINAAQYLINARLVEWSYKGYI